MQKTPAQLRHESDVFRLQKSIENRDEKIAELRDKIDLLEQRQLSYMRALHIIFLAPQDDEQLAILVREVSRDDKLNYIFLKDYPK